MRKGDFDKEWEVDFPRGIIRRKPRTLVQGIYDFFNQPRFRLSEFHYFIRAKEASVDGMPFPTILDSDGMKSVKGVPKRIQLQPAYSISAADLKVLHGDGYILTSRNQVLVPSSDQISTKWWENSFVQLIFLLAAFATFVGLFLQ